MGIKVRKKSEKFYSDFSRRCAIFGWCVWHVIRLFRRAKRNIFVRSRSVWNGFHKQHVSVTPPPRSHNLGTTDLLLGLQRASEIVWRHSPFGRQTRRAESGVEMIVGRHRDREAVGMQRLDRQQFSVAGATVWSWNEPAREIYIRFGRGSLGQVTVRFYGLVSRVVESCDGTTVGTYKRA